MGNMGEKWGKGGGGEAVEHLLLGLVLQPQGLLGLRG